MRSVIVFLTCLVVLCSYAYAVDVTIVMNSSWKDTTLDNESPDINRGTLNNVRVGTFGGVADVQRILLNLSEVCDFIPVTGRIINSTLSYCGTEVRGSVAMRAYPVNQSWNETDVTWNKAPDGMTGFYDLSNQLLTNGNINFSSPDNGCFNFSISPDYITGLCNDSLGDYDQGVVILAENTTPQNFFTFASSDSGNASAIPRFYLSTEELLVTTFFDSEILNGFNQEYILNLSGVGVISPDVFLNFNGTNYSVSLFSSNEFDKVYRILLPVDVDIHDTKVVNHSWFYNLSGSTFNFTDSNAQNLTDINVTSDCVGNASFPILNMSYSDEMSTASITATNVFRFNIFDGTYFYDQNGTFSGSSDDQICTNLNSSVWNYNWSGWGEITSLSSTDYATRLFEFSAGAPLSFSNVNPLQLSLSLILLNESTTVQYNWRTTTFQDINGIMRVYRCGQNGTDVVVAQNPIIDGQSSANIELLSTPYKYDVIIEGVVFQDLDGYTKCHIESQSVTPITYYVEVRDDDPTPSIGMSSVECVIRNEGDYIVNMSWGENPNDPSVITGCLEAFRSSVFGSDLVYENCTNTESSIVRRIQRNSFDYYVRGRLQQGGRTVYCNTIVEFKKDTGTDELLGVSGVLAAFFIIAAMALLFAVNGGEASLVAVAVGFIAVWFLRLFSFSWTVVGAVVSIVMFIIFVGRYVRKA